jgi:hypothetical protein
MRKNTPVQYALALALLIAAPLVLAFTSQGDGLRTETYKNFNPQATLSPDGRTITLSGAIGPCAPGEKTAEVQAAITQQTTYASANTTALRPCSVVHSVRFVITATVDPSKPAFVTGPAEVCGTGISRAGAQIIDIETWCTYVNLVNQ